MPTELKTRVGVELERLIDDLNQQQSEASGHALVEGDTSGILGMDASPEGRLRLLGQLAEALPEVDPTAIQMGRAGFGSTVDLLDLDNGKEVTYTLFAGEFIDLDAGQVSLASPIGHALTGRAEGEEIRVMTPRGERRFRIMSIITLPQMLGISENESTPVHA